MKIKVRIPQHIADISELFFKESPQDIISGLEYAMEKCKEEGYGNLSVIWSDYPFLYGMRDETNEEKQVRLKKEVAQKKAIEERKQKEINKAIQVLKKYKVSDQG